MSQKTNPTALRLFKNNKTFNSSWYSDFFYKQVNLHEIELRSYLEQLFKETGHSCSIISLQNYYRRCPVFLYIYDIRGTKREKEFSLRVPRSSLANYSNHFSEKQSYKTRFYNAMFSPNVKSFNVLPEEPVNTKQSFAKQLIPLNKALVLHLQNNVLDIGQLSHQEIARGGAGYTVQNNILSRDSAPVLSTTKQEFANRKVRLSEQVVGVIDVSTLTGKDNKIDKDRVKSQFLKAGCAKIATLCFKNTLGQHLFQDQNKNLFADSFIGQTEQGGDIASANVLSLQNSSSKSFLTNKSLLKYVFSYLLANFWYVKQTQNSELFFVERALNFSQNRGNRGFYSLEQSSKKKNKFRHILKKQSHFNSFTSLEPIRVVSDTQNVLILIDQVINLLQKRVSFRQIKSKIFRELAQDGAIKGVRLSCSGRLGGRSKKAQKSKMQKDSWGETSLHVFSSRVSFASKSANTSWGKVGVKLWLSFV